MKKYLIPFLASLLMGCDEKPTPTQNRLEAKWSEEGDILSIYRNGLEVGSFRDSSNALFIEFNGYDGFPDAQITYYDDDEMNHGLDVKSIALSWVYNDGSQKIVMYDPEGNLVIPEGTNTTE